MRIAVVLWSLLLALSATPPARSDTLRELVQDSDLIVVGRATIEETVREAVTFHPKSDPGEIVLTYVGIEPSEILKGDAPERTTVRIVGGRLDGFAYVSPSSALFADGEETLLFLRASTLDRASDGADVYFVTGGKEGKFSIGERDGQRVAIRTVPMEKLGVGRSEAVDDFWVDLDSLAGMVRTEVATGRQD